MSNYSTILDSTSVIYLGHSLNVPLMRPRSELGYGFEPHGHKAPVRHRGSDGERDMPVVGGVPGVGRLGGYQEGSTTGYPARARLRLINDILGLIGSYGRLTGN